MADFSFSVIFHVLFAALFALVLLDMKSGVVPFFSCGSCCAITPWASCHMRSLSAKSDFGLNKAFPIFGLLPLQRTLDQVMTFLMTT